MKAINSSLLNHLTMHRWIKYRAKTNMMPSSLSSHTTIPDIECHLIAIIKLKKIVRCKLSCLGSRFLTRSTLPLIKLLIPGNPLHQPPPNLIIKHIPTRQKITKIINPPLGVFDQFHIRRARCASSSFSFFNVFV